MYILEEFLLEKERNKLRRDINLLIIGNMLNIVLSFTGM